MSSHVRQHKSPYFYVRKGAGFVLLENHVETGTRYKTEAEAKRAVLALNDAWRAKGAKSNPRRRNPDAGGEAEMVLWARPAGQTNALYEQPIYTQGRTMEDIERVKKLAAKDGWHTFRVQRIDLSKPYNPQKEFAATIRGSRRRNPAGKYVEGRDHKGLYKLSDLKHGEFFKLKKGSGKVYRKGDYDRAERMYVCEDEDDISRAILVPGDRLVHVGFMY
jgi:hypothetical protein